ncbi:hypothetical protein PCASD_04510 [Puccinia coronata f. sp. avenae]|uniref:Uncharacterized protein n=1 Tax=Puccinia coronata f. sp. avenae TaxID=200324 RepID=A0A2N5V302_9BASI|nr:hypothetical protein PCASD_04510 [Puccinia coronata f. sp. avenae]
MQKGAIDDGVGNATLITHPPSAFLFFVPLRMLVSPLTPTPSRVRTRPYKLPAGIPPPQSSSAFDQPSHRIAYSFPAAPLLSSTADNQKLKIVATNSPFQSSRFHPNSTLPSHDHRWSGRLLQITITTSHHLSKPLLLSPSFKMGGDIRDFYKQERTCCLSIQLFTAGMMIILYFNTFLALFCACTSFFGPKILALVQPAAISYLFGVLYLVVAGLHVFGIICVERNHVSRFRVFKNVTVYTTGAIVILALVFIIRSAASHSTSVAQCMEVYHFPVDATYKRKSPKDKSPSSSAVNAAMTVCDLFSWVQVVVMSLVWLVLASTQLYFGAKHRVFFELKHQDHLEDTAHT